MLYASNWVAGRLLSWRYASAPVSPIERLEGLPAFAGLCTVCTGCRRGRPGQDLAANKDVGAAQCALFFHDPGDLFTVGIWGAAGHRSHLVRIANEEICATSDLGPYVPNARG